MATKRRNSLGDKEKNALIAGTLALVAAFLLALVPSSVGQVIVQPGGKKPLPTKPKEGEGTATQFSAIKLNTDTKSADLINVARECIKDKDWDQAVTAAQIILDKKEDFYVRVEDTDKYGRKTTRWTSVKYEANKLLGSMPDEGLDVYEVRYGGKARALLEEAKKSGDLEKLAEVAQKYLHTRVGAEANDLLATYYLDRGQYFMAALRFERLLQLNSKRVPLDDLVYFKMALAYRRAGDLKNADLAWGRLKEKVGRGAGVKVGTQVVGLDRLQAVLEEVPRPEIISALDWPLVRGNVSMTAQAAGSPPLLDELMWTRPTILDKSDITGEVEERGREAKTRLEQIISNIHALGNVPVLPGSFPIATGGKMIYRTYTGVTAVNLEPVKEDDGTISPIGSVFWKTTEFEGPLGVVLSKPEMRATLESWLNMYTNPAAFQSIIYENTLVGTLSSDGRHVFAVDDLAVPVPPNIISSYIWQQNQIPDAVRRAVLANSLNAYELQTGKGLWRLGGPDFAKAGEFADSHFLGAPLPVGDKIYVLNEKNTGELCLVCLDPKTGSVLGPIQVLGTVDQNARIIRDPIRRTNAVQLAYGEGILVCPTNAGEILGVDLMSRTLAWAYSYREKPPHDQPLNPIHPIIRPGMPLPLSPATWKWAPPAIADGKVVFTAPDAHSIHCINLRDGMFVWKKRQDEGDLFFAGIHDGKVLIVGRNHIKALRLSDGELLWTRSTGDMPSGHGVICRGIYYQPLKKGDILAVDLERKVITRNRPSTPPATPPGNLIFYAGTVLTQAPLQVMAYPQLSSRLAQADKELLKDPLNLEKLIRRGELRLADGQIRGAVEDLRQVLAAKPTGPLLARARSRLYDALTDLFQVDFNEASTRHLTEYEELCKVPENPDEEQKRLGRFYRLLGEGRARQGDLVEAFKAYRKFGSLPMHQKDGMVQLDDPLEKKPIQVWLRGKISEMMETAQPEQRQPLEEQIAQEWQGVKATQQLDAIRSFVAMFDLPVSVGREARLHLADAIIEKGDRSAFLEAQLNLLQLCGSAYGNDPAIGGRALEALARLEIRKGSGEAMQEAARLYRQLGDTFGNAIIRDGQSAKKLVNDLASDKRFLLYLDRTGSSWGQGPIKVRELPAGAFDGNLLGFLFQPEGELSPATASLRLMLDYHSNQNDPALRLIDLASGKVRWSQNLGLVQNNYMYFNFLRQQTQNNPTYAPNARFRLFHVKGQLAVVQVGTMIYAMALGSSVDSPRLLWSHSLIDGNINQGGMVIPQQVMLDADGNLQIIMWNQMNGQRTVMPLGHIGSVQASYVALVKNKKLVVLDPLRGTELWSKTDVEPETRVFGDDQFIYLVDVNGSNATGGRALRASDGSLVEVPDFSIHYQHRLRVRGRHILAATPLAAETVLRLHDARTGRDVWKKSFAPRSTVVQTENPDLTGIIEPDGTLTALEVSTGKELLRTSVLQYRISKEDVNNLQDPLLLEDDDHFYLALNQPIDASVVGGGVLANNFANGIRCARVNGWFCAFHRADGQGTENGQPVTWKKGEMRWHSYAPISNQLIVLEQFRELPVLLFTVRYHELFKGGVGGSRWVSVTQSINKLDGRMVYDPLTPRVTNGMAPQFFTFKVNRQAGTIDMIGSTTILQHYLDDGRKQSSDARPAGTEHLKVHDGTSNTLLTAKGGQIVRPNGEVVLPVLPPAGQRDLIKRWRQIPDHLLD